MSLAAVAVPPRDYMLGRALKCFGVAVIALVLLVPVWVLVRAGTYDSFVDNPLSGWGMWGTFIILLATGPRGKEIGATVSLALAMRLAYDLKIGEKGYGGSIVISMGVFLGIASLVTMGVQAMRAESRRVAMVRRALGVILIFNYLGVCLAFYVHLAEILRPYKLDYFLYAFDGSLGFEPAFALGKLVHVIRPLHWLVAMVYNSLGLWFCMIYAIHARAHRKFPFSFLRLIIANALMGFTLYFFFPAMGPKYAYPSFPNLPSVTSAGPFLQWGVPNAMPSLHFGGMLLIFWMARPWKWARLATGSAVALTAVATLGLGEHYLVDLVVALPYALAILAFACDVPERRFPLLAGAVMVFSWLGVLRFGSIHPIIARMLIAVTLIVCLWLERKLALSIWGSHCEDHTSAIEDASSLTCVGPREP